MDGPAVIDVPEERGRCRWCWKHKTPVTALISALALGALFIGTILMVRASDRTMGWSLLITAALAMMGALLFVIIMYVIRRTCPSYLAPTPSGHPDDLTVDSEADPMDMAAAATRGRHTNGVFLSDKPSDPPEDDFAL
jgi:hypothetical protein